MSRLAPLTAAAVLVVTLGGCVLGGGPGTDQGGAPPSEGDVNAVEAVADRAPEEVAAELRRRVDADVTRYAAPGATLEAGRVLFPPCRASGPGVPTAVTASYGVSWRVDLAEGERLLREVGADWESRYDDFERFRRGDGYQDVSIVEADGYDRLFSVAAAPDDGGPRLASMRGRSPCAALPPGSRLPTER